MQKRRNRHKIVALAYVWLKCGNFGYYSVFLGGHQLKYFLLSPDMVKHRNGQNKIIFIQQNAIKLCSILATVGENGGHFKFFSCEHSRTLL